ncbi:unnamed protein product [Angiostrongylus costaricensis]|uniref:TIL domain-containing protein n=1 Tax=Angiostrongylus costaricensis TaxID=334426 RepID=A0A0R3PZT5_ANGCS|nr:unnamed protein product [Angiostrongylus costaricensis]
MSTIKFVKLLLLFTSCYLSKNLLGQRQCAKNEEFSECGSSCKPSCRNPTPSACTLQCVIGCQCKRGFIRNDYNECVANCNSSIKVNTGNNKLCPLSLLLKLFCTADCIPNVCQCKHGLFRNFENKCVADCNSGQILSSPCKHINSTSVTK